MNPGKSRFGDQLSGHRLQAGKSQEQLARCLGVHRSTIERWEHSKTLPKSRARVEEIVRCLGLTDKQKEALLEAALFDTSSPIWNVPYRRNPFFTGQESLLTQLHDALLKDNAAALVQPQALTGLGGIGKTQLALEYAYRYRDHYQAVLWARADSSSALTAEFVSIAHLLNLPEKNERDQQLIVEAVLRWVRGHTGWLLILDNVDLAIVEPFLPKAGRGHILLTTRAHTLGGLAQSFSVEQMNPSIGALLLLRRAEVIPIEATLDKASPDDRTCAESMVQLLGCLPLALNQAGAYIRETACGIQGYMDRYQVRGADLLRQRGALAVDYPESVATTFSLAFEKIKASNPTAAELLQLFALLYPDKIPEELIIDALAELNPAFQMDPLELDRACRELLRYSLVVRDSEDQSLSVHRLVQAVLKDEMSEEMQQQWAERAVRSVGRMFPNPQEVEAWLRCERYLPQAQTCAALIQQWNLNLVEAFLLLNRVGYYLYERALYPGAEKLMTYTLSLTERDRGPNHPDVATELNNLAVLYDDQGKYGQAEPLLQRALSIRERVMGPHHLVVANSLNNLAMHYYSQGKYEQAEPLLQRALSVTERNLGSDHPRVATNLNNLALLYKSQSKYERATTLYQQALSIREQTLAPNHPDLAQSLNNLAGLYLDQGRHEEAAAFYQRALSIFEQAFGHDHPTIAQGLNNLAMLFRNQERYEQAEVLYLQAFSIFERTLGPGHPDTMRGRNNLAMLYRNQERYEQAESLYLQTLSTFEQKLGLNHPHVAQCLNDLALLYKSQGKHQQAEPLYRRALFIRQRVFGPRHPDVAQSLNNLAALYNAQYKYEQAEPFYQRAISIFEQVLGPHHPNVAQCLNNLAALYYNQGKYEQAESLYLQAISIFEQAIGHRHSKTARVLANYAILLRKMKRDTEATKLLAQMKTRDAPACEPLTEIRDVVGKDVGIAYKSDEQSDDALKGFFISYAYTDWPWAKWIVQQLEKAGYSTVLPDRDFLAESDLVLEMDTATKQAERTIAVLSPDYLASNASKFIPSELAAVSHRDPKGEQGLLILVRVHPCDVLGLLGQQIYIDLVDKDEQKAKEALLAGVQRIPRTLKQSSFPSPVVHEHSSFLSAQPAISRIGIKSASLGTPFPEVWNVPRRHVAYFTGRDRLLEQLFQSFSAEGSAEITIPQALVGLGGLGKTQTAAEYAYRYRGAYQAVLWVRAETKENLVEDLKACARLLNLHAQGDPIETMQEWFRDQADWLLILDNADDLNLVAPFLPQAPRRHVLLTIRARAAMNVAQPILLEPLGAEDGALCILRRAGAVVWNGQLSDASPLSVDAAQTLSQLMEVFPWRWNRPEPISKRRGVARAGI